MQTFFTFSKSVACQEELTCSLRPYRVAMALPSSPSTWMSSSTLHAGKRPTIPWAESSPSDMIFLSRDWASLNTRLACCPGKQISHTHNVVRKWVGPPLLNPNNPTWTDVQYTCILAKFCVSYFATQILLPIHLDRITILCDSILFIVATRN